MSGVRLGRLVGRAIGRIGELGFGDLKIGVVVWGEGSGEEVRAVL